MKKDLQKAKGKGQKAKGKEKSQNTKGTNLCPLYFAFAF